MPPFPVKWYEVSGLDGTRLGYKRIKANGHKLNRVAINSGFNWVFG
jgi:hypothetical protein